MGLKELEHPLLQAQLLPMLEAFHLLQLHEQQFFKLTLLYKLDNTKLCFCKCFAARRLACFLAT